MTNHMKAREASPRAIVECTHAMHFDVHELSLHQGRYAMPAEPGVGGFRYTTHTYLDQLENGNPRPNQDPNSVEGYSSFF
ncbi:hypothetical protein EVAR_88164_1 [Eumeta japonica]|uniref:Uncharacterized protein n=1 Tax=Eumeta variegata TaxID=151549 RepID=A0A4C1WCC7_EUMVA|nr:hypothetical protein EVAR_88164_1 [Eumeta japonica]